MNDRDLGIQSNHLTKAVPKAVINITVTVADIITRLTLTSAGRWGLRLLLFLGDLLPRPVGDVPLPPEERSLVLELKKTGFSLQNRRSV